MSHQWCVRRRIQTMTMSVKRQRCMSPNDKKGHRSSFLDVRYDHWRRSTYDGREDQHTMCSTGLWIDTSLLVYYLCKTALYLMGYLGCKRERMSSYRNGYVGHISERLLTQNSRRYHLILLC